MTNRAVFIIRNYYIDSQRISFSQIYKNNLNNQIIFNNYIFEFFSSAPNLYPIPDLVINKTSLPGKTK